MIEKMKMVHIVTSASGKEEMLKGLRDAGILHLAERQNADRSLSEQFQTLSKAANALKEYEDPKSKEPKAGVLDDAEFEKMYRGVLDAIEKKESLTQAIGAANTELDRISAWGDFSPEEVKALKDEGFDLHFYRMGSKEFQDAVNDENVRLIRLASVDKMDTVAVLGTLPPEIPATEFMLPEQSISDLKAQVETCRKGIAECEETLKAASVYGASFNDQMVKLENRMNYSAAGNTAQSDEDFVWISGYIPEEDLDQFKAMAEEKSLAWAIEDVSEDDENIPTKVKYNKVSGLIKPDGAYGVLILLGTIALHVKQKKLTNATFLLYVLSIATIIWGAVTGTWFGMESVMNIPFFKRLVIPSIATYPEYFGLTASDSQNAIMKFSFTIGAVQMALGSLLAIRKKIPAKDLSWVADTGWMIAIIAMYMLSLNLVIHEDIDLKPVFILIGIAFALVVLFGGMAPGVSFGDGLKAGLGGAFTQFLNTISCFGNVMSYIRLFAVGMAGVAISQSFNGIAAGMHGPLIIVGVIVVLVGHALNIVMCFLSVVVHGVRLNVLEFSGQVGLEWTGIPYEPFKKM